MSDYHVDQTGVWRNGHLSQCVSHLPVIDGWKELNKLLPHLHVDSYHVSSLLRESNESTLHHLTLALSNSTTGKAIYWAAALQISSSVPGAVQPRYAGCLSDGMETGFCNSCWDVYYTDINFTSCQHGRWWPVLLLSEVNWHLYLGFWAEVLLAAGVAGCLICCWPLFSVFSSSFRSLALHKLAWLCIYCLTSIRCVNA